VKVGVVVVTYRSDDLTVRFVREELSRISIPHAVVVVANGSTQEEADALSARIPEAVVIPSENKGFAAGNNIGVRYLAGQVHPDYILLANNDIRFRSDRVVEQLCETLVRHPEAGAAGPEVIGPDGLRQGPEPYRKLWPRYVWMYLSTPFLKKETKRRLFRLDEAAKAQEGPQYKLSGCFLLIDPEAFLQAGGFDEGTFLYAEENILSDRFKSIGKVLYFDPSVTVFHEHGQTVGKHWDARKQALMQFDSMGYYYRTYRGYSRLSVRMARWIHSMILKVK